MTEIDLLKKNLTVVLVRPSFPGNIGSVARAIKNMGFSRLSLVNPVEFHNDSSYEMACKARDILENAEVFSSIRKALATSNMTVGTSRRIRKLSPSFINFDEEIDTVARALKNNRIHIVFGTEKSGLTNEEICFCQHNIAIPTEENFGSLNLSQAVLIVCYEIRKAIYKVLKSGKEEKNPINMKAEDLELMYDRLNMALVHLGYENRGNKELPESIIRGFRRIFSRAGMEERDHKMIMGFCSQILDIKV